MKNGLPQLTDEALWNLYRQGNEAALAVVYERYVKRLYAYGRKFGAEAGLVKDCIQDLFAELLSKPQAVSQTPSVQNYLLKALRRKLLAKSRKSLSGHVFLSADPDEYLFELIPSPEQELIIAQTAQEDCRRVQEAIGKLTKRQQEIIYLKFYHDLDNHSIAEVMSLTYQAVCNLVSKAVKAIRKVLSNPATLLALLHLGYDIA
ncbi:sigma-70 family RNA polymerase sigma factor [Telluribacter sp.]|jgi:RNA polymerase sigma factor (sigma-70 family)|uniref:RNA polymerase sigma factor n=1 Tax=Telluribacter sp. TaxID=1978767 RepID=UPI002E165B25|nr:sigma-70 family RNA polymerase sigma factor [Telluribacter sp.]